jgi:hypothetical protein
MVPQMHRLSEYVFSLRLRPNFRGARLLNSGIAERDYGVLVKALVTRDASSIPPPLRDSVER